MSNNHERTITNYINTEVKEYAISVVEERAIPSIVDGFKPVQRKIVFTADKVAKSFTKTAALVGQVMSVGGYFKGDGSIGGACGKMAQDFAGSNNHPFLEGQGEFGKRLTPDGISAPRYTDTRIHSNFNKFFQDMELLKFDDQEGKLFEPRYYYPIIPSVLLNGVSGIAVGFAVKILPYNLKDLIYNTSRVVLGKPQKKMIPYWEGYNGTVVEDDDGFIMRGIWERLNSSTVRITEVPVGISRDKYVDHLNKMEERGDIKGYDDDCKKEFNFTIHMKREILAKWESMDPDYVGRKFKLVKRMSENLNLISENGKLISFDNVNDIIEYFTKFRMGIFAERKVYFENFYKTKISDSYIRKRFIKEVMAGKIEFKKVKNKADLRDKVANLMAKHEPSEDQIEQLINISIYKINKEEIVKIDEQIDEWKELKKYYKDTPTDKLFVKDLKTLAKGLK